MYENYIRKFFTEKLSENLKCSTSGKKNISGCGARCTAANQMPW
jgi:hypothetical protein